MQPQTKAQTPAFTPIFAAFSKIDEEQRMVFGYATTETRDQQGEIVRRAAIEAALPDYMKFANIREMHQPWAVGVAAEASVDETGFWLGAHVVDDDAWKKVKAKVYKGFSIGGRVTARDLADRTIITGLELNEVSLVDRPANPDAVYTVVKRVEGVLREQPLQKWDCGIAEHQHRAKNAASECMADRARTLQKLAVSTAQAAATVAAAAAEATDLAKGSPNEERDGRGRWTSGGGGSSAGHKASAEAHHAESDRKYKSGDVEGANKEHGMAHAHERLAQGRTSPGEASAEASALEHQASSLREGGHERAAAYQEGKATVLREHARSSKSASVGVSKGAPKGTDGKFSTHQNLASRAHKNRASHDRAAAKARDESKAHRDAASRSLKAGDAEAVALHEHLAGAAASLAETHGRAAEKYRDLAARHESEANKLTKEADMPGSQARTIIDAERDAEAAIASITKAVVVPDPVEKAEIDHKAESRKAREQALDQTKSATEHEESSAASREAGRVAKAAGNQGEADEHHAEADVHDSTAVAHHEVADKLNTLHAHHVEKAMNGEGLDHAKHGEMAKDVGAEHAACAHHAETMSKLHEGYASGAVAKSESAGHHAEMAGKYKTCAAKRGDLAKRMTDVHTECAKRASEAEKVAKAAAEAADAAAKVAAADEAKKVAEAEAAKVIAAAAAAAKVKPITGLKKTPDGWVDVSGASFFGKRDIKDEERVALVAKGLAMPDGSFPIAVKEDVADAVAALGKAGDAKDAVQVHIIKAAVSLSATDALPKEWEPVVKTVTAPPAPTREEMLSLLSKGGLAEVDLSKLSDEQVKSQYDAAVKAAAEAAEAERVKKAAEAAASGDTPEKRAEKAKKSMGLVAALAQLCEHVEMLCQSSTMEEALEGDADSPVPGKLDAIRAMIGECLEAAVREELEESAADEFDDDTLLAVSKAVRGLVLGKSAEVAKRRAGLKKFADLLDKAAAKKGGAGAQKMHDKAVKMGAKCAASKAAEVDTAKAIETATAAALSERDRALKLLDRMTGTLAAVTKDVTALRDRVGKSERESATLKAEIKRIGDQPLPQKGKGVALTKGADGVAVTGAVVEESSLLSKVADAEPGAERSQVILDAGEALRARTLLPRSK